MLRIPLNDVLLVAERLHHILLFAYPAAHRREYGPLMAQLFRDLCHDSHRQGGFVGLLRLWSHVLKDTVVTAAVEHLYTLQEGGQIMTKKQHWMVLALAGLPLELGALLFLINPAFMGQMFTPNSAQPAGWLMVAAVLILAGTAYVIQRRIIVLSRFSDSSGQAVQGFLFACSVLLLVLPAALLVLLGPAIVMVLRTGLYP